MYVNGDHRDAVTALGKLVHDIFCEKPDDMYNAALAERVRHFKEDEEGVKEVSEVMEKIRLATVKDIAQRMLDAGEIAITKIAEYTGLSVSTVRRMAKKMESAQAAQA